MNRSLFAGLSLTILILPNLSALADPLWLRVGEVRNLAAAPDATIRIAARGIVRAVEDRGAVRLIGLKPGVTTVVVDKKIWTVSVSAGATKDFYLALRDTVSRMKGLKLVDNVMPMEIDGTLLRFSDWQTLARLSEGRHGQYVFRAGALDDVAPQAIRHFQSLARARGLPVLRFSAKPRFTVHIPLGQKGLKQVATELFEPWGIQVAASDGVLPVEPLVRTHVILAELSRSQSQQLGIEWPSSFEAQLLPAWAPQGISATLKALESNGQAQILASPNLLCRSGGEARFHAGGEFPIRVVSRTTRDVMWKKHGVMLNVRPRADFQGALSIEVETEISLLDMANAVDGIPALKTNRVKSHFDLPGKRTIALSGLIRQDWGRSNSGLPMLADIPVLGALFSSRTFQAQQSELVIFVTPEIHTPEADQSIEMPKGWVRHEW